MILNCPFCRTPVKPEHQDCAECTQRMVRGCPNCNETISVLAKICKYCGEAVEGAAKESTPERPKPDIVFLPDGSTRSPSGTSLTINWEEKGGFFSRWWGTWKQASFKPGEFMKSVKGGSYCSALGFVYGMFVQALLVAVLIGAIVGTGLALGGMRMPKRDLLHALTVVLVSIPIAYVAVVAGTFLASGFWHLMARLAGGTGTFKDSFRMVAYSTASAPWALIPGLGKCAQIFFQAMMLYHGFREVHGLSKRRSILALVMPAIVGLAIVGTVAVVAVMVHLGGQA